MRRGSFIQRLSVDPRDQRGFTLVELMVALTIFAVLAGAAGLLFGGTIRLVGQNRYRSVAANLASQELDSVRAQAAGVGFASLPVGQVVSNQVVDGNNYIITRDSEWITEYENVGACDGTTGNQLAFLRETVTITWPNMQGVAPVQSQTVVTPPVGTYDPNTGHIAVKVLDRDGLPQNAIAVTAAGPSGTKVETTTADGCAFFAYLVAGAYTVSLGTAGYVDGQGNPNPSQSATVQIGTVLPVDFDYDLAATLSLTLAGAQGGALPAAMPLSLGNSSLLPKGTKSFGGTGTGRLIPNLFPYLAGYEGWAGDCADADPEGTKADGSKYYPTGQRPPPMVTQPGTTTAGSITLATLNITVKDKNGIVQVGKTVIAHHYPDNGCAADEFYTLGNTGAGGLLSVALPYGTWELQIQGKLPFPGPAWTLKTLDPTVAGPAAVTVQYQ